MPTIDSETSPSPRPREARNTAADNEPIPMLDVSQASPLAPCLKTSPANPGSRSCSGRATIEATIIIANSGQNPA